MKATVLTSKNGLFFNLCEEAGIPALVVADLVGEGMPPTPPDNASPRSVNSTQEVAARLRDLSPDVIHCHDLQMARAVVPAANAINVPCVLTLHETGVGRIIRQFVQRKQEGFKFTVITVSRKEFDVMRESGMAGIDFHYVPNGTPPGPRRQEQDTPRKPNLMMVANLGFVKGVDIAILAMVELRQRRGPDCPVLNIYGAGALGEYLMEMARVLHVDDVVRFHGIQMNILDKCPSSDMLVVPSRFETGPLVVPEAMSRGMPVVACSVGEVEEMLPGRQYGRIVPVNSITALADAIDSMLTDIESGQFDPNLPAERHHEQFSIEKMADRIADIYQSAIADLEPA